MRFTVFFVVIYLLLVSCEGDPARENNRQLKSITSLQDSILFFTDKISEDSADYHLYVRRAELFVKSGKIDPALRDINYALELNQDDPDVFILLGDVYFILGQTDNSLNSYKKAYTIDPGNARPLISLAEAYLVLQDYEVSRRYLDRAASIEVNHAKTYYLKGILDMETGDSTSALTNLKIAGNIDTLYFDAFMQTGALLSVMEDTSAGVYYKKALKVRPGDERAMFLTALSYQEKGDFNAALDLYEELIAIYPGNKNALFNSGYIYMVEMEDFEKAISYFRQAIVVDPGFVSAVYNLGRTYEASGMYEEARIQYRQALELQTNYSLAIEGLNRLDKIQFKD
jgi:tetratricopeptide (TPR) repeat protein